MEFNKKIRIFLFAAAFSIGMYGVATAGSVNAFAGAHYVNMGSSFAAGWGISPINGKSNRRCRQSKANYASILAEKLDLKLEDRSCGGTKSIHLLEQLNELPPQIDAINKDTKLVTISTGGNDLRYIVNLCALSCNKDEGFVFDGKKYPCLKESPVNEAAYTELKKNLEKVVNIISMRAPEAKIIFIQYVTLVPEDLCETTPLSREEAGRMRIIGKRLAQITADVARESGAMLLEMDILSIGHSPCDKEPWSVGFKTTADNAHGAPWHPNRLANEVIAERLQKMLGL